MLERHDHVEGGLRHGFAIDCKLAQMDFLCSLVFSGLSVLRSVQFVCLSGAAPPLRERWLGSKAAGVAEWGIYAHFFRTR